MKKPTRAQIVAEARAWCGVPVFHHGRDRAGGVDCLGLVLCVGQASGALVGPIDIPDYGRLPNPRRLIAAMDAGAVRLAPCDIDAGGDDAAGLGDGDIVGLSWGAPGQPMHLAITASFAGRRTIVHASPHDRRVVEVSFAGVWISRFEGCPAWRFPNLAV